MTYSNQISAAMKSEFENKYNLNTRMTVAKYKKQAKMVKYLERSCPITVRTKQTSQPSYEVRLVDAYKYDGQWSWNDSTVAGKLDDISLLDNNRKLFKWMRDNDYLDDSSKGKISVVDNDDVIEIVKKSNGMPMIAFVKV